MKGNLNVTLVGRGPLVLRESNYVTSGGEGAIYVAGNTVIKIYADKRKMVRDGMAEKIRALSAIKHPSIVAPAGIVTDDKSSDPIGFHMPLVSGEPLPRAFTADFRARTGFADAAAAGVAHVMWDATRCAHDHGAVMVDANEFNWLLDDRHFFPRVIDVDSWAIARWPATVIMPSIRDWRAKSFDAMTDWFSWGIVAFQVFTGIHPYKGRLDGYKPGDLERRMRDGASVFAPGVRLPQSARDPSRIPGPLLDWFRDEFQDGGRSAPPDPLDVSKKAPTAAKVMRTVVGDASGLVHEKVFAAIRPVVRVWPCGAALLDNGEVVDMAGRDGPRIGGLGPGGEVVRADGGWLLAHCSAGKASLWWSARGEFAPINLDLAARALFRSGDRLFVVTESELVEVAARGTSSGPPVAMIGQRWGVRPNATRWFDGVAVQDVLGAAFLVLPTKAGIIQARATELDGLTPIAGVGSDRFACIVASDRTGAYRRVEFAFDASGSPAKAPWIGPNDGPDLNMVAMPSGAVATVVEDGEIVIFVPANGNVRKVQDAGIATNVRLSRWGTKVVYLCDGAVWWVRTK
jgi:hypothetical protein